MNKRKILMEAIADAKTVKDSAIANAQLALTETFTPQIKSMLAAKLEEMEKEEDALEEQKEIDENQNQNEELDLDEVLQELENDTYEEEGEEEEGEEADNLGMDDNEEIDLENMTDEDLKIYIEGVIGDMVTSGELEAGENFGEEGEEGEEETGEEGAADMGELGDEEELMEENDPGQSAAKAVDALIKNIEELLAKVPSAKTKIMDYFGKGNSKDEPTTEVRDLQVESLKKRLGQAMKTVQVLTENNKDINLLNSKLLYTSKVFRKSNLTESQKIKVLGALDKTKTVKEAKLVYETLIESLIDNRKNSKRPPIKGIASSSTIGKITENKNPIMEVDEQYKRWQVIAGLNNNK
jgi:hypothetical protein